MKPKNPKLFRLLSAILPLALALGVSLAWAPGAFAADKEVLVGLAGPLTGPSARSGKGIENGAQLAIDRANAEKIQLGGDTLVFRLIPEDDQSDPRTAVAVAQRLVDQGVIAVVGHWNTGASIPASRVYNEAGIPELAPGTSGHAFTQQGYDTSFRLFGHDDEGGQLIAGYVLDTLKGKRIAVIDDRTAFGQGLADQFEKSVKERGGNIVAREFVDDKTVDFSPVLTTIRAAEPDILFFGGVDAQGAPLARRIKQLGIRARLVGAGGFVTQTFIDLAQGEGDGVVALEPGLDVESMPGGKAFKKEYEDRFKIPVEVHSPFAYDGVGILVQAIKDTGSLDPAKLVEEIHKISYQGVTGTLSYDAEGNIKDPVFTIYEVVEGAWKPVATVGGSK